MLLVAAPGLAFGQAAPPSGHHEEAFDFMNLLDQSNLHDIKHETWNAYGQFTYISSWKLRFDAPYTNLNGSPNSLSPAPERSFTGSFTLFLGAKLWRGAEAYLVPEVIAGAPALEPARPRRRDSELRAAEDRRGHPRSSIAPARSSGRRSISAANRW